MIFAPDIVKTLLLTLVILAATVNILGAPSGEKTLNLRIGFDLTEGSKGPALRIRAFEDSRESKHRSDEGKTIGTKPTAAAVRADSNDSEERDRKELSAPKRADKLDSDKSGSDSDEYADGGVRYSTRGMNADYEPEERAQVIKRIVSESSDSASDRNKSRRKRSAFYDRNIIIPKEKIIYI